MEIIRKYYSSCVLTNVQNLLYIILTEVREWTAKNIIAPMIQLVLRSLAYIIPEGDFYAQLSTEQLTDELSYLNFSRCFL
ncbi:MAG: hypothetical protein OHK0057_08570 [Thermoflexibacter sp.]